MKIIIVGGTGTLGKAVVQELSCHDIITVGYHQGDIQTDITQPDAIENMYKKIGKFDAVVATTGKVHFAPLSEFNAEKYTFGLQNKLLGQVNLVLIGLNYINEGGSFTLTSGILSDDPIPLGSSAAMVNGALNAFVKSAAIEMPKRTRINIVSPTVLTESMDKYAKFFPGFESVAAKRVALAYQKSVEGAQTGCIYKIW